jgi:hypothetical protein
MSYYQKTSTYLDQHHGIEIKIKLEKLGIMFYLNIQIKVRKYRCGHQNWTTHKHWKYKAYKTQDEEKQNKNTAQYE